jgi:hypothetical protein
LRTETAGVVTVAVVMYACDEMNWESLANSQSDKNRV